jgi:type IV pilus assembly protein PilV
MKRSKAKGSSFIEVLVSMLVFGIGILSISAAHGVVKKSDTDSLQRTIATQIAEEAAKKMRINTTALASYITPTGGIGSGNLSKADCNAATVCTPQQIAANDLAELEASLRGSTTTVLNTDGETTSNAGGLIEPTACIAGPAEGVSGIYTIAIAWRGLTPMKNPTTHSCGTSTTSYGNENDLRRVILLSVFIG